MRKGAPHVVPVGIQTVGSIDMVAEITLWFVMLLIVEPESSNGALVRKVFPSYEKCDTYALAIKKRYSFKTKPKCRTTTLTVEEEGAAL